jgi:hypothetical protein
MTKIRFTSGPLHATTSRQSAVTQLPTRGRLQCIQHTIFWNAAEADDRRSRSLWFPPPRRHCCQLHLCTKNPQWFCHPAQQVLAELRERFHQGETHLHADHQIPIEERPDLRLNLDNMRTRCNSCHNAKTMRESVTLSGIQSQVSSDS